MRTLIKNIDSLVTVKSNNLPYRKGKAMQDISEIKDGAVLFSDVIEFFGTSEEVEKYIAINNIEINEYIKAKDKTILPGFVDSHTHIIFAGNRSSEFARRLRGATYQEIANEGGGIITTMEATRKASVEELFLNGKKIALNAIQHGTTAFEIKSGYGLSLEAEIKLLKAIKLLKEDIDVHIAATFLGAHDFPPEYKDKKDKYVDIICNEMIPKVAEEKLADFCDVFIDEGYFTLRQSEQILRTALDYGLKLKVHCDELANIGATELCASLGAISVDHLLFISKEGIDALSKSHTIATLLPGTAYFIRMPYAPARQIIDSDVPVSLATDCNPGSCFTENMQIILSLSVINMKMTAEEAVVASTLNAASAIAKSDEMGSIDIGKKANLVMADCSSYTDIFYHFGVNHIEKVWINGITR